MIPRAVLKSSTPGLPEDEIDHDSVASGPSDAEFEADEAEQCEETSKEAKRDEVPSPSPPPVPPKDSYSIAMWNHPLPEPANNLPLPRSEAHNLVSTTTPPLETPATLVPPHSTTDDQHLSDISASDPDSANLSSDARNEWEDVNSGKSEKMSTWNCMKQGVGHVRRRSRSNSIQHSLRGG